MKSTVQNPLMKFVQTIPQEQQNQYKCTADVELARVAWELENDKNNAKKRDIISLWLRWISVSWLAFSAIVICLMGLDILTFNYATGTTFIAGSLLEVFGLWKIALNYYFNHHPHTGFHK
jgi:hypothetical protein